MQPFVLSLQKYSDYLEQWMLRNLHIRKFIFSHLPVVLVDSTLTENYVQSMMLSATVDSILEYVGECIPDRLSPTDIESTFCEYLMKIFMELWEDKWKAVCTEAWEWFYLDRVISQALMDPPGSGICCLCLMIAADSRTELSDKLIDCVECSRLLCPRLPFSEDHRKNLLRFAGSDTRLRLGLLLSQAVGRISKKAQYYITASNIFSAISDLLSMLSVEVCREEIDLIVEVGLSFACRQ